MSERTWKLEDLARDAGVSPRTVRYYVQRGLLEPPVFRGRDTVYTESHLVRLRAIRRLQERFLPLDAIQAELLRRSDGELEALTKVAEVAEVAVAQEPVATPTSKESDTYRRYLVAPGLEIHVADDADPTVRALADKLVAAAREG